MENLDNIKVTVIEKNAVTVTASQQMISFPTLVGPAGPQGPQGPAGPSGQGAWGTISGDISDQTDLQDALDLKANTADLGEMATVDDAPSDDQEYVRKNGAWAVSSGGGGGGGDATWGSITGTLSNQIDLQSALNAKQNTLTFDTTPTAASTNPVTSDGIKTALDAKANSADLGDLAEKDKAAWSTDISGIPSAFPPETHNHDDRYYTESETDTLLNGKSNTGHNHDDRYYTETEVDTALSAKANNSILGDAFSTSTAYAIGDYCIYEGALYRFTSVHSAGAWNGSHVTQVVAMNELAALSAQVASRRKFEVSGTASAGSSVTITDSRINDEHWQVPKNGIWFSDSSKVTTQVHWVTNITNHTLTLEATFTGATNVKVDLDWYQDIQSA